MNELEKKRRSHRGCRFFRVVPFGCRGSPVLGKKLIDCGVAGDEMGEQSLLRREQGKKFGANLHFELLRQLIVITKSLPDSANQHAFEVQTSGGEDVNGEDLWEFMGIETAKR